MRGPARLHRRRLQGNPTTELLNLYFNYSIDCETPANTEYTGGVEREPFFNVPVRTIIGGSHNTSDFADTSHYRSINLDYVVQHTRDLAGAQGLDFEAASFESIYTRARDVGSY